MKLKAIDNLKRFIANAKKMGTHNAVKKMTLCDGKIDKKIYRSYGGPRSDYRYRKCQCGAKIGMPNQNKFPKTA